MVKIKRVYEQIRDKIEQDALSLTPGEFLSSEMSYSRMLDVSRLTVRKAVDDLVRAGLVRRIPGKGLVVSDRDRPRRPSLRLLLSLPYVAYDSDFFQVTMGCIDRANELGLDYRVLSYTDPQERLDRLTQEDLSLYDGAVVCFYESPEDDRMLDLIRRSRLPFIQVNENDGPDPSICADSFNGGYIMGEYLIRCGHRDILFITSDRPVTSVRKRTDGFRQALMDNDLPVREDYFLSFADPGDPLLPIHAELRSLPAEAEPFLRREKPFTALCGYSSLPILSMLGQLHRLGWQVPQDVSVVTYGNAPYFEAQAIPLTSVLTPNHEMGSRAVELLYDYLTGASEEIVSEMFPVSLSLYKSVKSLRNGPAAGNTDIS